LRRDGKRRGAVSRTAHLDGAKIHFTDYAADGIALVFVHGWACDETFWSGQTELDAKYRVITIDLPGHGQSDNPATPPTMDLYARAIGYGEATALVNGLRTLCGGIVPDLDFQVWDGASHFLMMEQPERFNNALVVFLKKHRL
jgi:pimeloyl-ACP methyl ester carboxylesterase